MSYNKINIQCIQKALYDRIQIIFCQINIVNIQESHTFTIPISIGTSN